TDSALQSIVQPCAAGRSTLRRVLVASPRHDRDGRRRRNVACATYHCMNILNPIARGSRILLVMTSWSLVSGCASSDTPRAASNGSQRAMGTPPAVDDLSLPTGATDPVHPRPRWVDELA